MMRIAQRVWMHDRENRAMTKSKYGSMAMTTSINDHWPVLLSIYPLLTPLLDNLMLFVLIEAVKLKSIIQKESFYVKEKKLSILFELVRKRIQTHVNDFKERTR